jgi:hypothetical protein
MTETTPASAPALLRDPDLFGRIARVITDGGFAGDPSPAMLAYVAFTSRLLPRPLCFSFVAPSSAGKSEAVRAAMSLFPSDAYVRIDASSERAFIYKDRDDNKSYQNRTLVVGEADSIPDDGAAASALRSLISDGELNYDVCEKAADGGFKTNRITKNGPTGFITTGTRSLPSQFSTRMLEIGVSDSPEQTRAIMYATNRRLRAAAGGEAVEVGEFVEAQRWLQQHGARRVVIPFDDALADLIPADQLRMRRDYGQLLVTIQAVALLHQCQRERDESGAVIATLEDYAHARALLAPIFDAVAVDGLTPAVRKTIEAIRVAEIISISDLARRLSLSKSAVSDRVKKAVALGYLQNAEVRAGHPALLSRTSEQLPDGATGLPSVEQLRNRQEGSGARSERLPEAGRIVA